MQYLSHIKKHKCSIFCPTNEHRLVLNMCIIQGIDRDFPLGLFTDEQNDYFTTELPEPKFYFFICNFNNRHNHLKKIHRI